MNIICKNCGNQYQGNYCNICGQSAETDVLCFRLFWHELQHGFFYLERGIFYTVKQLFTRPGHAIREYVEGKRVRHLRPISLVILLATIYGVMYHFSNINLIAENDSSLSSEELGILVKMNEWVGTHFAWVTLLSIPFFSLASYLAFKKQDFNYFEHLVLNAFLAGQRLVVGIITFPVLLLFEDSQSLESMTSVLDLIGVGLTAWGYSQFFYKLSTMKSLALTLLSFLIFLISIFVMGLALLFAVSKFGFEIP